MGINIRVMASRQLAKAHNLAVSEHYIVGFCSSKVVVLTKDFKPLKVISGLKHADGGIISPDEKYLLIFTTSTKALLYSLETFEKISEARNKGIVESFSVGCGCWTLDGDAFYFHGRKDCNSILRKVQIVNGICQKPQKTPIEDGEYLISGITAVPSLGKYLLLGFHRKEMKSYIIWMNDDGYDRYPLEYEDNLIFGFDYDEITGNIFVCGMGDFCCDRFGRRTKGIDVKTIENNLLVLPSKKSKEILMTKALKIINRETFFDSVCKTMLSNDGKYMYVATLSGFYVYDIDTMTEGARVEYAFGMRNIVRLRDDLVAVVGTYEIEFFKIEIA